MQKMIASPYMNSRLIRFATSLRDWGKENSREFPWRHSSNLYHILLSEYMLHRTRAEQALGIFNDFVRDYPTLESAAIADDNALRKLLMPLGLKWRIELMILGLRDLYQHYGDIPEVISDLQAVRGIGPYIAGATLCFGRSQSHTLIDTNIVRVVGRFFGIDLQGEARRRREIREAINELTMVPQVDLRVIYYAIIDLAHGLCRPKEPDCPACPLLNNGCEFGIKRVSVLPTK